MYYNGQGVAQDDAEALKLFQLAAAQGNANALNNLGVAYREGRGVPQDDAEAAKWFGRAAEQAVTSAMTELGRMYYKGKGVPQNYVLAYMWLKLATSQLPPGELRDTIVQARDGVARLMTEAQLAEAQRLARNWKPKPVPEQ